MKDFLKTFVIGVFACFVGVIALLSISSGIILFTCLGDLCAWAAIGLFLLALIIIAMGAAIVYVAGLFLESY